MGAATLEGINEMLFDSNVVKVAQQCEVIRTLEKFLEYI